MGVGELVEVGTEVPVSRLLPIGDSLFENKASDKEKKKYGLERQAFNWLGLYTRVKFRLRSPNSQLCELLLSLLFLSQI